MSAVPMSTTDSNPFLDFRSPESVTVWSGARLHFGPLSYLPRMGRHFGGVGLMLSKPEQMVRVVNRHHAGDIRMPESLQQLVRRLEEKFPESKRGAAASIDLPLPRHLGLGSGTQLALAVTEAWLALNGRTATLPELLRLAGRGKRSGIGAFGYLQGGFIVDAGHRAESELPDLACRIDYPPEWAILLVLPRGETGLHGTGEEQQFAELPEMPEAVSGTLCRLVLTEVLPALRSQDFAPFSQAMREYGEIVGDFFAPRQGGRFSSPVIRAIAEALESQWGGPLLQSSWGPGTAALCGSVAEAREVEERITRLGLGPAVEMWQTGAANAGRTLKQHEA